MKRMNMKRLLLVLVALTLALTAAPAAAEPERHEGFRSGQREGREWHEQHERREHERWEHRRFGFFSPAPYAAPYCYTEQGSWAWNGWRYVWVPPQTVCQ